MQPVREALARLDQVTSGAPPVETADLPETKEKITGGHNDMVPWVFLDAGLRAGVSVAKLEVPRFANQQPHLTQGEQTLYLGTGWIIAPGMLITNHHVLNARNDGEADASEEDFELQAAKACALFDFDARGAARKEVGVAELLANDKALDYALVRLNDATRAPLRISSAAPNWKAGGEPVVVNIIQHPNGDPKKYGIRNNLVTGLTDTDLRYFTDTDGGSSGSPVFNDNWEVVALHRGSAYVKDVSFQGRSEAYVNLGTRIDAILADLAVKTPNLIPAGG
jgi:endonuclease G